MDRRHVLGIVGGGFLTVGLGLIGTWDSLPGPNKPLGIGGSACAIVGFGILGWLWVTAPKPAEHANTAGDERMARDTFNNFGTNNGIIGPVSIGRPRFELTSDLIHQVVGACPRGVPVLISATGSQRVDAMHSALRAALQAAGFAVQVARIGMMVPPPSEPLSITTTPQQTIVTIAPDV